jgi:hypothetical protein
MKQHRLIENIEADSAELERALPASIKSQYRSINDALTRPDEARKLFQMVVSRVEKEQKVVAITKILLPYLIRDLDQAFKTPDKAMNAYKTVYSLVYKTTTYNEWSSIDSKSLIDLLDRNKSAVMKIMLTELKSFLSNPLPSHPTTIRLATVVRNLRSLLDWPELNTVYLSLHNAVFNQIAQLAAEHNYYYEEMLVDYISRNQVDLSHFPKIRDHLNREKNKILVTYMDSHDDVVRDIATTKLWVDKLKEISLDWPELDNVHAVYDMIKPAIVKRLLYSIKQANQNNYLGVYNAIDMLINHFKINWPELKVMKKSLDSTYRKDLD